MNEELAALALRYAPIIKFDRAEPFFPVAAGVTVFDRRAPSPSFKRLIEPVEGGISLEYAVYWDWDIGHLYDLEHIWIHAGPDGRLAGAEASFHGRYLRSILPDRRNVQENRLVLYSQAGKHAFSPLPELFSLLPDSEATTTTLAGEAGFLVTGIFEGILTKTEAADSFARTFLRNKAFRATGCYSEWSFDPEMFMGWEDLARFIPRRLGALLADNGIRHY